MKISGDVSLRRQICQSHRERMHSASPVSKLRVRSSSPTCRWAGSQTKRTLMTSPNVAGAWGWNSLQHYAPNDYSKKTDYLIQSCRSLAKVLEKLSAEEPWRCATIHVWIAMTDIVNYVGIRSSDTFTTLDSRPELVKYFMQCFEILSLERKGINPIIVNINGSGEFLSCRDVEKFQKVSKNVATELRAAGYMVSWNGPMWREIHPFLDSHEEGHWYKWKAIGDIGDGKAVVEGESSFQVHDQQSGGEQFGPSSDTVRHWIHWRIAWWTSGWVEVWGCQCDPAWLQFRRDKGPKSPKRNQVACAKLGRWAKIVGSSKVSEWRKIFLAWDQEFHNLRQVRT